MNKMSDKSTPINSLIQEEQEQEQEQNSTVFELVGNNKTIKTDNNYDSYIIKPPPKEEIFKNKVKNLFIDSRDRNQDLYPSPSKFEIKLKEEYKYIKSINLVMAQIPNTQYLINKNNNILHFYIGNKIDSNDFSELKIDFGNYPDPSPINNYLPNILPALSTSNSYIFSSEDNEVKKNQDSLSIEIENKFTNYINYNYNLNNGYNNKPLIEVGYNVLKDNYIFSSDLCPFDTQTYKGNKLNLCFKGEKQPYGCQDIEKVPKINQYDRIERDEDGKTIYEEIKIGEERTDYQKKSIGKIIGFGINNYDGYIINNLNNIENRLIFKLEHINSENKNFTDKIEINSYILLEQQVNSEKYIQRFKIEKIINGNSFKVYDPNENETGPNAPLVPPGNPNIEDGIFVFNDASLYNGTIKSPFRKNFTQTPYVILKIRTAHKIDSENDSAQNSFGILPFEFVLKESKVLDYSQSLWKRNFNPPLPSLSELNISLLNYDGSYYDFNNYDVNFQFVIETLNQSIKYGR